MQLVRQETLAELETAKKEASTAMGELQHTNRELDSLIQA